ncbi:MAG: hypothetical protein Kow0098_01260 [Ignavibacteriaceae bacterium]
MLSRKDFIRISAISLLSFTAGHFTKIITRDTPSDQIFISALVPGDISVISKLISALTDYIGSYAKPVIDADREYYQLINSAHYNALKKNYIPDGEVIYSFKKLTLPVPADIVFGDRNSLIYSPDEFTSILSDIRHSLKGRKAEFLFTALYKETDLLTYLSGPRENSVVIENEKGIVDKIILKKNYNEINVPGAIGNTGLTIQNGIVRVNSSTCRNGLCKNTIATTSGNLIVCAPNKLMIKII